LPHKARWSWRTLWRGRTCWPSSASPNWTRLRYSHAVWHLFVLAGSICHYIAVLRYVALPAA